MEKLGVFFNIHENASELVYSCLRHLMTILEFKHDDRGDIFMYIDFLSFL